MFASGDTYKGEWSEGEMTGEGLYAFANGDVYAVLLDLSSLCLYPFIALNMINPYFSRLTCSHFTLGTFLER